MPRFSDTPILFLMSAGQYEASGANSGDSSADRDTAGSLINCLKVASFWEQRFMFVTVRVGSALLQAASLIIDFHNFGYSLLALKTHLHV